jgi:acyl carrier protein
MEDKLIGIFNSILDKIGNGRLDSLNPETSLRNDLKFDSLNLAELTVRIEDEFGIDIFEDEGVETISDIVKILQG